MVTTCSFILYNLFFYLNNFFFFFWKDFLPVPDGNVLAHSNEFGGSLEFFEPDDYFGVNIREL